MKFYVSKANISEIVNLNCSLTDKYKFLKAKKFSK
jgi:hypothetical protein